MTWTRAHRHILRRIARRRTRALGPIVVRLEADARPYQASVAKLRRTLAVLDIQRREAASIALYRARVDAQRQVGLAHVRAKAARVRAELGLEEVADA